MGGMKLFRQSRRFTALLALVSVLFMQLAVAAYACPRMAAEQLSAAAHESMQDCHEMDMGQGQPNMCQAHDQAGTQSLDKPASPDIQPFVPAALQISITAINERQPQKLVRPNNALLTRATAPPHAIDHCCFRI